MLATDLAYYLVRKGVAFREAHHIAGQVVSTAEKKGILIHDLTLEELKNIRYTLFNYRMNIGNAGFNFYVTILFCFLTMKNA